MSDYPQWHDPGEKRTLVYEVVERGEAPWSVNTYASVLRKYVGENAEIYNPRLSPSGRFWLFAVRTTKSGFDSDLVDQIPEEDVYEGTELRFRSLCPSFTAHYR